jgi:hypothetical protein
VSPAACALADCIWSEAKDSGSASMNIDNGKILVFIVSEGSDLNNHIFVRDFASLELR